MKFSTMKPGRPSQFPTYYTELRYVFEESWEVLAMERQPAELHTRSVFVATIFIGHYEVYAYVFSWPPSEISVTRKPSSRVNDGRVRANFWVVSYSVTETRREDLPCWPDT